MRKSKSSRIGKKAWRTNIITQHIEDFYEKSSKDALSGGPITGVSSDYLFFVDKFRGRRYSVLIAYCRRTLLFSLYHHLIFKSLRENRKFFSERWCYRYGHG